jgi:hypothetical protein
LEQGELLRIAERVAAIFGWDEARVQQELSHLSSLRINHS